MRRLTAAALAVLLSAGCGGPSQDRPDVDVPVDGVEITGPTEVVFWHSQTMQNAEALQSIADEFNSTHSPVSVRLEYTGNYNQMFRKVMAGIQVDSLPDVLMCYPNMVTEFMRAGVAVPLDEYIESARWGFSPEDLTDFHPEFLARDPLFGGKLLSFPFCKSVLIMYYNRDLLDRAGIGGPPRTWDDFVEACRAVKGKLDVQPFALAIDASMATAIAYSMGGDVYDESSGAARFDSPESRAVFDLLHRLAQEKLVEYVAPRTFDDVRAFVRGELAFVLRTSASRPFIDRDVGDAFRWDATIIPQADPDNPATVLFGPDVCILRSTPERQLAAWRFVKHLGETETTVDWATATGYMPLRKSAENMPKMQGFFAEKPVNRRAFDIIPYARREPNLPGWQRVRELVEDAETAVLVGTMTPDEAVAYLQRKAERTLADNLL